MTTTTIIKNWNDARQAIDYALKAFRRGEIDAWVMRRRLLDAYATLRSLASLNPVTITVTGYAGRRNRKPDQTFRAAYTVGGEWLDSGREARSRSKAKANLAWTLGWH